MDENIFWCRCGNSTSWKKLYSEGEEFIMCEVCKQVYKLQTPNVNVMPPFTATIPTIPPPPVFPTFNQPMTDQVQKKTLWGNLMDKLREKREIKQKQKQKQQEENEVIEAIKSEARQEAFRELKPELVKKFKEEEIKKLTGQAKTDRISKFADAFKLTGEKKDVVELMTGKRGQGTTSQTDTSVLSNDRIASMMSIGSKGSGQGTDEQIDKMLKRKKKYG